MRKFLTFFLGVSAAVIVLAPSVHALHSYSSATFSASGDGRDSGNAVTVDQNGNVFVVGSVYETSGGENLWIGKYNSSLALVSSTTYKGAVLFSDRGYAVHADTNGFIYAAGFVREGSGQENVWVGKYDNSLLMQTSATVSAGGGGSDSALAATFDLDGNLILCGYVNESLTGDDFWLAQFSSNNLAFLSSTSIIGAGSGRDRCEALAVNSSGRIFAVGTFADPSGKGILMMARFSRSLVLQTTATFSGPGSSNESANDVAIDSNGSIYVAGVISHATQGYNAWIGKYSNSLVLQSSVTVDGPANDSDSARTIAVDASGDVYAAGILDQSVGGENIWIARYDSSLVFEDSVTARMLGSLDDGINAITIDDSGNLYAVGITSVPNGENIWISKHATSNPMSGSTAASVVSGSGDSVIEYAAGSFSASSVTVVFDEYVSASSVTLPSEASISLDTSSVVDISVIDSVSSTTLQPSGYISVRLRYEISKFGSSATVDELYVGRYESGKGWSLLETSRNTSSSTVTGLTNHLSQFGVLRRVAASALSSVKIYPNPFWPARGHQKIFFDNVPMGASVEIYTITGLQVRRLEDSDSDGRILWDAKNAAGLDAASGVYFALVNSSSEKKVFKFAVER